MFTLCLIPYGWRLRSPSLYADDIERIIQLQNGTLGQILFIPCNEHLAPLFQTISWLCWQVSGERLAKTPVVFTLASFLPFLPVLGLLHGLIRRETGSGTIALASLAIFSLSWLSIETVYWYSASSFMWSLLATLAAWLATASAVEGRIEQRRSFRTMAALATASAPAFSAIGMLAGPVAAMRALAVGRAREAIAPIFGTLLTLILYGALHDRAALVSNVSQSSRVLPGLIAAGRAPAASLVPSLFGLKTWEARSTLTSAVQISLTLAVVVFLLVRAQHGHDRALTLGGLTLIGLGYGLAFCARAGEPGQPLLETQRYHLFPMLGFVFVMAPRLRLFLAPIEKRPLARPVVLMTLTLALLLAHQAEMKGRARFIRFPDQVKTLAAIERLGTICSQTGISRDQALVVLDPIEPAWTPVGRNALALIPPVRSSTFKNPSLIKSTLLSLLTTDERRCLCGTMDATPYLRAEAVPMTPVSQSHQVALYRVREVGEGRYLASGWPSFIEFEWTKTEKPDALALALALALSGSAPVDVWWRGDHERWSETRSLRLRLDPAQSFGPRLLPLAELPHWNPSAMRRIRLLYHEAGPIAVAAPRLVR